MSRKVQASRERYRDYLADLKTRYAQSKEHSPSEDPSRIKGGSRMRSARDLVREFFRLAGPEKKTIFFALATLTVSTLLALVPPASTKFVIDNVLGGQPMPVDSVLGISLPTDPWTLLVAIALAVFAISLIQSAVHIWGRWRATQATKRMQMSVRKRVFEHAVRLPLSRVQELRSGGVASILREDAGGVANLIFGMIYNPWRAIIQLLGSLIILAWVDWRLLLSALLLLPVVWVTHRVWITRVRPQFRDIRGSREEIDAQATESFGGMRVVRAFGRQHAEADRFMRNNHYMGRQELHTWWWSRTIELVWQVTIPLATTLLLLYCGWQVLAGMLTLGDVMMFTIYLVMLLEPIAVLAQSATQFQNSLSGLDRVLDLLGESREMQQEQDENALERPSSIEGAIAFETVNFTYPGGEQPALTDVSLDVAAGKTIALVGPSGAGKTTLCNLVARFYDPEGGRILLDRRDLREYEVENYRRFLGVVEQDVFLFDGSVRDNIGYARPDADDAAITSAAEIANADEFIRELPQGYDTIIGERGVKLSGGQRQRLAIARAILANPRILILDEATSNLDTRSERLIQSGLAELMRGRTCFVIAHRLSTIAHADEIVVLDGGRIIERGSHEELIARSGTYAKMVDLQTRPVEIAEPAEETQ